MQKPIVRHVITRREADLIRDIHFDWGCDSISDDDAVANVRANRPAFFSFHSYSNAVFAHAAHNMNSRGLAYALKTVREAATDRRRDPDVWVRDFLARIAPANIAGQYAIEDAEADLQAEVA